MLLEQVYENAPTVKSGTHYTTINEFTDQQPALRPDVLIEARNRLCKIGEFVANKILVEEDKGAILGAAICLEKKLPLAVARWYNYDLINSLVVPIKSEYFTGNLYMNGISPGDRVVIVDDTISTGGTLAALIEAVNKAGAKVVEILVAVEKVDYGGVKKIQAKYNLPVKSLIQISIDPLTHRTKVLTNKITHLQTAQ
ncbi:phosphoribosyltransferase family protein [Chlorogloeopsis sp. ULAP01]|uniref:phosphoribosyltransferase family protein n=1 Tax=Chlorogloeopsis sp. ULAP01 TaxID=3056483 RepID=UPI0025AA6836|nr:phosphoribosyltransferase family protein [Chlorogloeopsis sp. ULAP01]MDM9382030.1 phosphoribosyltransferase family protein [Chlorogloeopsis sp. ULAP01]